MTVSSALAVPPKVRLPSFVICALPALLPALKLSVPPELDMVALSAELSSLKAMSL